MKKRSDQQNSVTQVVFAGEYLAEEWQRGACFEDFEQSVLREADLRDAWFHFGSSRSGLVDSPIASEGNRTGFYADEFLDQGFKTL